MVDDNISCLLKVGLLKLKKKFHQKKRINHCQKNINLFE